MAADGTETGVQGSTGVVETRRGRPTPLVILLIALVAASAHVAVNGYSYGGCTEKLPAASPSGDHANILPWVYWYQDNSLFPHDPQIQSRASYATVLWRIVAWCGYAIPLPYVFFVFHILALIATYAALFCLAQLLGENAWAGVMACVLFIVARNAPAGEATHDPAFYTRVAALPLVLASIYGALRSRPIVAFGTLLIAEAVHLLLATYAAPVVIGLWLFSTGRSRWIRAIWVAGFCLAWMGVVLLIGGDEGVTLGRPSDEWLDLQRGNNVMHLFPSEWPRAVWHDLIRASFLLLLPMITTTTPTLRRFAIIVIISCGLLALAGWAFAEKWPSMLIMQSQLMRGLKVGMILAFVSGAAWLGRSTSMIHWLTGAVCIIAWVGRFDWVFLTALATHAVVRLTTWDSLPLRRKLIGRTIAVAASLAVAVLLVRNSIETPQTPQGTTVSRYRPPMDLPWHDRPTPWIDIQKWVALNTPTEASFVTPPILEGFRTHAKRSEFVDWKQGTLSLFHERFGLEWMKRLSRLMGPSGGSLTYIDLYKQYNALTATEFQSLAGEYGLTHAVTMKPVPGLTPIHRNQVFWVYQLR